MCWHRQLSPSDEYWLDRPPFSASFLCLPSLPPFSASHSLAFPLQMSTSHVHFTCPLHQACGLHSPFTSPFLPLAICYIIHCLPTLRHLLHHLLATLLVRDTRPYPLKFAPSAVAHSTTTSKVTTLASVFTLAPRVRLVTSTTSANSLH